MREERRETRSKEKLKKREEKINMRRKPSYGVG